MRPIILALVMMPLSAAVATAAPFCTGASEDTSFRISSGFSIGGKLTDDQRNEFDMMRLRQMGVDATRVERWNGCIRAFVRKPTGGEEMQFFEPGTYERVG